MQKHQVRPGNWDCKGRCQGLQESAYAWVSHPSNRGKQLWGMIAQDELSSPWMPLLLHHSSPGPWPEDLFLATFSPHSFSSPMSAQSQGKRSAITLKFWRILLKRQWWHCFLFYLFSYMTQRFFGSLRSVYLCVKLSWKFHWNGKVIDCLFVFRELKNCKIPYFIILNIVFQRQLFKNVVES